MGPFQTFDSQRSQSRFKSGLITRDILPISDLTARDHRRREPGPCCRPLLQRRPKPRPHVFGEPSDPPRHYDGIVAFSQTDFTADLKKITAPVLVMHGDDDQIVPYADSAPLSAKLLKNGTLKIYKGFPHCMPTTQAETINADLLAFIRT